MPLLLHPQPIKVLPPEQRDKPYPSKSLERAIYERDSGKCLYCGVDVLLLDDQKKLHRLVGDEAFAMGRTNQTRSGAMIATRATADHVIPRSQGGKTTVDNLVTACWPCQFGKAEFSPGQLGLEDPRNHLLADSHRLPAQVMQPRMSRA
jgi:5-methylcytosine-specific restriction endonuclease McrA